MSDVKPVTRYIEADVGVVEADETTREGGYVRADAYDLLAKERDHLSQRVAELEAGISQCASECVECEGSGKAPHYADRSTEAGRAEPMFVRCKQCADIRALIAKSGGV